MTDYIQRLPDAEGKVAVVTGANAGIGFEIVRGLALKNTKVIMACRSVKRGEEARNKLLNNQTNKELIVRELNLASFESIREFAAELKKDGIEPDLLINNAGVMIPPFSKTQEGFELQFGVNFLGHFLLTGLLLPVMKSKAVARVVTLSSIAANRGKIDFDNFRGEKTYRAVREYGQSKLADLMFAIELNERLSNQGSKILSIAAHPGVSKTELTRHSKLMDWLSGWFSMKAERGALPALVAALGKEAKGGSYWGPSGWREMKGDPASDRFLNPLVQDRSLRQRLWSAAEQITGVKYPE